MLREKEQASECQLPLYLGILASDNFQFRTTFAHFLADFFFHMHDAHLFLPCSAKGLRVHFSFGDSILLVALQSLVSEVLIQKV